MTEPVVDLLEVIDVDHEAGQRMALTPTARELLVQARLQIPTVVPARQHVGKTAAHEPRPIDGVLESKCHDDGEVMQEVRGELSREPPAFAAAQVETADDPSLPRERQQRD